MATKVRFIENERVDLPDMTAISSLAEDNAGEFCQEVIAGFNGAPVILRGLHVKAQGGAGNRNILVHGPSGISFVDADGRVYNQASAYSATVNVGTSTAGYLQARIVDTASATAQRRVLNTLTDSEEIQSIHTRWSYSLEVAYSETDQGGDWFTFAEVDCSGLSNPTTDEITDDCLEIIPAHLSGGVPTDGDLPDGFTTQSGDLTGGNLPVDSISGFDSSGGRVLWGNTVAYYRAAASAQLQTITQEREGSDAMGDGRKGEYVIDEAKFHTVEKQIVLLKKLMQLDRGSSSWSQAPWIRNSSIDANTIHITIGDGVNSKGHVNNTDLGAAVADALAMYPIALLSGLNRGFEIYVKPGSYKIGDGGSASRVVVDLALTYLNVTIRGAGKATVVWLYEDSSGDPLIYFGQSGGVLRDMWFGMAENIETQEIIETAAGSSFFVMDNISIDGLLFHHGVSGTQIPAVRLQGANSQVFKCYFNQCHSAVIYSNEQYFWMDNSLVFNSGPVVVAGTDALVNRNVFRLTKTCNWTFTLLPVDVGYAVFVRDAKYVNIAGNEITGSLGGGVGGISTTGYTMEQVSIAGNIIKDVTGCGVKMIGAKTVSEVDRNLIVSANMIEDCGESGVYIDSFDDVSISNNIVYYTEYHGIYYNFLYSTETSGGYSRISDNLVCEANQNNGSYYGIYAKGAGIAYLYGVGIIGNVVSLDDGCAQTDYAIYCSQGSKWTVTGNTCGVSDTRMYSLYTAGDRSVVGDNIAYNLYSYGNAGGKVDGNIVLNDCRGGYSGAGQDAANAIVSANFIAGNLVLYGDEISAPNNQVGGNMALNSTSQYAADNMVGGNLAASEGNARCNGNRVEGNLAIAGVNGQLNDNQVFGYLLLSATATGSTANGNTVTGNFTVSAQNCTANGNTVGGNLILRHYDCHFGQNNVTGTVTAGATGNTLTGCTFLGNRFQGAVTLTDLRKASFTGNVLNAALTIAGTGYYAVVASNYVEGDVSVGDQTKTAFANNSFNGDVEFTDAALSACTFSGNMVDGTFDTANGGMATVGNVMIQTASFSKTGSAKHAIIGNAQPAGVDLDVDGDECVVAGNISNAISASGDNNSIAANVSAQLGLSTGSKTSISGGRHTTSVTLAGSDCTIVGVVTDTLTDGGNTTAGNESGVAP